MSMFHRQSLVTYGQPLQETTAERPTPHGSEVLVRTTCCGVCHSDLHLQDGYFALGGDRRLDITKDRTLPFTLGHEIAGVVEAAGENVEGAVVGRQVAIYPWIGCGQCAACRAGEENMCSAHHHLGVAVDGGYASYVMVPHPRYLIDHAPLAPSFADIDAEKRKAALGAGAAQAFDPADPQTRKAILAASGGGLFAVCDFVGSDK